MLLRRGTCNCNFVKGTVSQVGLGGWGGASVWEEGVEKSGYVLVLTRSGRALFLQHHQIVCLPRDDNKSLIYLCEIAPGFVHYLEKLQNRRQLSSFIFIFITKLIIR